ncbi:ATP-binding protein [bacterium]|nr:ATP-binding protein [bacterium]
MLESLFRDYFGNREGSKIALPEPPDLSEDPSVYASIIRHYPMSKQERLITLLALAPHIRPWVLDIFFTKNGNFDRPFTEFGGIKGIQHGGFLPSGETVAFLLSGKNPNARMGLLELFGPNHFFAAHKILHIESSRDTEPFLSGALTLSYEYLSYFTVGEEFKPTFSSKFPAQVLNTPLEWEDLILDEHIVEEIEEILTWLKHSEQIMEGWGLKNRIKPGYRSLFYGPPGTGKTLAATLLGKVTGRDVYRVDLSKVVSKYIGETEKNMAQIFDLAENKSWILFFDEADALFGKRTATSDAKDRYANQEVAYLLQRIEDFAGVIVLASNLKSNLDEAFARRFQSMIHFPVPSHRQRLRLWENAFEGTPLSNTVDLEKISEDYELTGGAIINILRNCTLSILRRNEKEIQTWDIIEGIRREFAKEGKMV